MTDQNTKLFAAASAWTAIPLIQRDIENWTAAQRDAFLQMLLNRCEYGKDKAAAAQAITGDGTKVKLTPDGGLAVRMNNQTGGVSVKGNVVCPCYDWTVSPGTTTLSNQVLTAGAAASNTHAGRLYLSVTVPAGAATVSAYSDSARTTKVAEGALADNLGGTVSLVASGGSGLSFDIDIEAGAVEDLTSATSTMGVATGVELTDTSAINAIGVIYESGIADEADVWVVVAGHAYVSIPANAAVA